METEEIFDHQPCERYDAAPKTTSRCRHCEAPGDADTCEHTELCPVNSGTILCQRPGVPDHQWHSKQINTDLFECLKCGWRMSMEEITREGDRVDAALEPIYVEGE